MMRFVVFFELLFFVITLNIYSADITKAGYNAGGEIPAGDIIIDLESQYNVHGDDNIDDTAGIQQAINDYKNTGQIVVLLLPKGVINISGASSIVRNGDGSAIDGGGIYIDGNNIILRGRGIDDKTGTKIVYNNPIDFYVVESNTPLIDGKVWPGLAVFQVMSRETADSYRDYPGSTNFHWVSGMQLRSSLMPGTNGINRVYLNSASDADKFNVNDSIWIGACNTVEFLSNHFSPTQYWENDNYFARQQLFHVTSKNIDGADNTYLILDEPLEFDIPYSDDGKIYGSVKYSKVMPIRIVKNVGFEDFTFYHSLKGTEYSNLNSGIYDAVSNSNGVGFKYVNMAPKQALHTILFKWCENVWVKNVKIEMSGSHPIVTENVRFGTFKDNILLGSWNKGKGGMGYFRGSKAVECLFENNFISFVRHLSFQWSATGNVSRYNIFYLAGDMNFHGGWERYNLVEHIWSELDYRHQSWNNEGTAPEGGTWYPLWWAASPHAGKWAGVGSGPYNEVKNNVFYKQKSLNGLFEKWGFYDVPGYSYIFGWDGTAWRHLNTDGNADGDNIILSWEDNQEYDFTASGKGVYLDGSVAADTTAPTLSVTYPTNYFYTRDSFYIQGEALDNVACKISVSIDKTETNIAWGMIRWRYPVDISSLTNGIHKAFIIAVDGAGNNTSKTLFFYVGSNNNVYTNSSIANSDSDSSDYTTSSEYVIISPRILSLNKDAHINISYYINSNDVSFEIYDILGRLIKSFKADGKSDSVEWSGKDNNGTSVAAGLYFLLVRVDGKIREMIKLGVLK